MKKTNFIPSVNFHLTKACNMKCKYCFAEFRQIKKQINLKSSKVIIQLLWNYGFKKINFVGGEPFLIKAFSELLKFSKNLGFYTSIVTNGSFINKEFLETNHQFVDMIGVSIDSLNQSTNKEIGRYAKNLVPDWEYYEKVCKLIAFYGIDLKINTVVSKYNLNENFIDFILSVNPIRWKVFQVLGVKNENSIEESKITLKEFKKFIECHMHVGNILIRESNEIMRGSYVMINPEGCFYDNSKGEYSVSSPIIKVGIKKALSQIHLEFNKYKQRDGNYFYKKIYKLAS